MLLLQSLGRKYTRKPPFFWRGWSTSSSRFYFILISSPFFYSSSGCVFAVAQVEENRKKETAWSNAQWLPSAANRKLQSSSRGHSRMAIVDRHFDWWGKHFITVSGQSHSAGLYICVDGNNIYCCAYYRLTTGCWNASYMLAARIFDISPFPTMHIRRKCCPYHLSRYRPSRARLIEFDGVVLVGIL